MTADQLAAYQRDGYILLPGLFGDEEVASWRREADRLIKLTINASLALNEVSPRLDLQSRDGTTLLRKIQPVNDISELFAQISVDERLLNPMRDILGTEPLLMEEKLNYKQILPGPLDLESGAEGESFPFHTDIHYFALDGYPRETLSSALSIDETTSENGPMRIIPGSHHKEWPLRGGWPPILDETAIPQDDAIEILGPPGTLLIFHSALVHASSENRTEGPRRLMIFSHYPSTHEGDPDRRNRPLRDRAQNHERRYREAVESGRYVPGYQV